MIIPKRISLANIPTPVHKINYNGAMFLMKRDDLTGVELTGNKIRKLEYLIVDAKKRNADYIFTCGGEQSNHARASVIASAAAGIKSKIFLWGTPKNIPDGNLFLSKLYGAEIEYLSKNEYSSVNELMEKERKLFEKKGKRVYVIPEGGSSPLGIWGYINFIAELKEQSGTNKIKGILTAAGSGGTTAGLLIGNAIHNLNLKIFAVNVLYDKITIQNKIVSYVEECLKKFRINIPVDYSNLEIMDGYSSEGYKHISREKLKVIKDFAKKVGILLDPAYTGKAFYAFNRSFLTNKKSSNVMFIHTGGLFGAFSKRKSYLAG